MIISKKWGSGKCQTGMKSLPKYKLLELEGSKIASGVPFLTNKRKLRAPTPQFWKKNCLRTSWIIMGHFKSYFSLFGALVLIWQSFSIEKSRFWTKIAIFKAFVQPLWQFLLIKLYFKAFMWTSFFVLNYKKILKSKKK